MESEGLSVMAVRAIVVGAVTLAVAVALLWMYRRKRGAAAAPPRHRERAAARPRDAPAGDGGEDGVTLRLEDGDVAERTLERPPEVEVGLGGGTVRLVNTCPNHGDRRARWTCPYCKDDFCEDCRRFTGALHHCPGERCAVRAARAVEAGSVA